MTDWYDELTKINQGQELIDKGERLGYFEFEGVNGKTYCVGKRDLIYTDEDKKYDPVVPDGIYLKEKGQTAKDNKFIGYKTWPEMIEGKVLELIGRR